MPNAHSYDPASFWNARARTHAADPVRAVGLDDADENRCIEVVQRHLLQAAIRRQGQRGALQGKGVLDVGCGTGRWVAFLRQHGLVYHGADIAEEMLVIARRCHPGTVFQRIDDDRMRYPDATFDLVWSVAVVHHNPYEAQERMLAEMTRVMKRDGTLILLEGLGKPSGSDTNYFPRPLPAWQELAARYGLSCSWNRGATYMLLRPLVGRAALWLAPARLERWRRRLTRMDSVVDPYLLPLLPRRFHTRAVMLFAREERDPALDSQRYD